MGYNTEEVRLKFKVFFYFVLEEIKWITITNYGKQNWNIRSVSAPSSPLWAP